MNFSDLNFKTIGILGGGQLGRMMVFAAKRLGMRVIVLDPDPDAPAAQVADSHIIGSFRDDDKIRELAKGCDVLTVEIEHVDTHVLEGLQAQGIAVQPSPATVRVIQDKFTQKQHLANHGLPVAPFREVYDLAAAISAGEAFGYPYMLKSKRLAYDGHGNAVIRNQAEIAEAIKRLSGESSISQNIELYAEAWMPFTKELAVMVARDLDGNLSVYPVVETTHIENICHTVIAPAPIPESIQNAARDIAGKAIATFGGAGIFGVEMFLLPDNSVVINEIAPRPHNSGHYTIEACNTDQFEQHIRAITGLPLGDSSLKVGAAVMLNVLGAEADLDHEARRVTLNPLAQALTVAGAGVHWYGKSAIRARRKMGHITFTGSSLAEIATRTAGKFDLGITPAPLVGIIMGSDSDLPTMKQAAEVLKSFGVPFEITIVSAHRTPLRMVEYAKSAHERGLRVIIAGAGGAAHLPGMVAAITPLPVIGVPVRSETLSGVDALYSIVQMPRGVPVATVAIGNATNAGLLAVRLLGSTDHTLRDKMIAYQQQMESTVIEKVEVMARDGWEQYKV